MLTETTPNSEELLAPTSAAHRRRRHLSVYHRALRSAKTPQQRAAVAARYRKLFATGAEVSAASATGGELTDPIQFPVVSRGAVRLAS